MTHAAVIGGTCGKGQDRKGLHLAISVHDRQHGCHEYEVTCTVAADTPTTQAETLPVQVVFTQRSTCGKQPSGGRTTGEGSLTRGRVFQRQTGEHCM